MLASSHSHPSNQCFAVPAGPGSLPDMHEDDRQLRLERTLSERLAECGSLTQHIPRTNSVEEGPCYSELSTERQRMQERLARYSLCEREVKGDGNCQVCCRVHSQTSANQFAAKLNVRPLHPIPGLPGN